MSYLHLVRITFELLAPLSIGSGQVVKSKRDRYDSLTDKQEQQDVEAAAIQRDPNGLPSVPGASYQGVLRRLALVALGPKRTIELLGIEEEGRNSGRAGSVLCGWGMVHDAHDDAARPTPRGPTNDEVLCFLAEDAPLWRDHVALNHRHSTDGKRKFARAAVPRGARFSLEMARFSSLKDDNYLIEMAGLFGHPDFRLGSSQARGYGRIKVIRASYECCALADPMAIRQRRKEPPSKGLPVNLLNNVTFSRSRNETTVATINLSAIGLLRFGAAKEIAGLWTVDATDAENGTKGARSVETWSDPFQPIQADRRTKDGNVLRLLTEPFIRYSNGELAKVVAKQSTEPVDKAQYQNFRFPVPGSAIRGPLAHRTLFWWNKANGRNVDAAAADRDATLQQLSDATQRPEALAAFFGNAKGPTGTNGSPSPGRAGRVIVDDAQITATHVLSVDHASIDRFTGGVRDRTGALFAEEALVRSTLEITVRIHAADVPKQAPSPSVDSIDGWSPDVATAFLKALRDLCDGRLPLGARSLGACSGTVSWTGTAAAAWRTKCSELKVPLSAKDGAQK